MSKKPNDPTNTNAAPTQSIGHGRTSSTAAYYGPAQSPSVPTAPAETKPK